MSKIRVAFQGIHGAYSEEAILSLAKKYNLEVESVPKTNFRDLFEAIDKETYIGLVPIENSTAGSVVECYDLLYDYDFEMILEYNLNVKHCLLANKGVTLDQAEKIISHPQALSQCSNFIEKANLQSTPVFDTAGSAQIISENNSKDTLAIASEVAADKYNLEVLKRDFQNNLSNTTRFLLIKKKNKKFDFEKDLSKSNKTTVMFETKHIPAALYKCLGGFATYDVNLTKIESRPKKQGKIFQPVFYLDFNGNLEDKEVRSALEELEKYSKEVRYFGSYLSN